MEIKTRFNQFIAYIIHRINSINNITNKAEPVEIKKKGQSTEFLKSGHV